MGFASGLAAKNLIQRPGRTIFSILGITVGIATVVLVFAMDHNTMVGRQRKAKDVEWQADVEVRPKSGMKSARRELTKLKGIERVSAHFQQDVLFHGSGPGSDRSEGRLPERETIRLFAMEAEIAAALGVYQLREGRDIAPDSSQRECLLGAKLAEDSGVGVGDQIFLSRPRRAAKEICVEGEFKKLGIPSPEPIDYPLTVVGLLEAEKIGRRSGGKMVVVDYDRGRELFEGVKIVESYWVKKNPDSSIENLQANLGEQFSFDFSTGVVVGQSADERAFRNGVRLAGLFAMVLGLYVIFHTLSMSLVERVREVGMLNALGATRKQIALIFFIEALFISLAGGFFGVLFGLLGADRLLNWGITTIGVGYSIPRFTVPWATVLPLAGIGVAIALIGSVYPMVRARSTNTVAALRGEDLGPQGGVTRGFQLFTAILLLLVLPGMFFSIAPVIGEMSEGFLGALLAGVGVLVVLIGLPLIVPSILTAICSKLTQPFDEWWPLAGQLSARSIRHSPTRISASIAAIALVTAAFVSLNGMTNSLRAEVEEWANRAVIGKLWVRGLPDVTYDELREALGPESGVVAIEAGDARVYNPFLILGMQPEELAKFGPCAKDAELLKALSTGQGIILSERVAEHYAKKVGDAVHLNTGGHGIQSFAVIAISDEYGYFYSPDERLYGIVASSYMQRYFCLDTDTTSFASLKLEEGNDGSVAIAALKVAYGDSKKLNIRTGQGILDWHVDDITKDFRLFDIILGLTALLAALGVLNGQLLSALERWKEIGVLRALGVTRGQVAGMVMLESAVIGLTGAVLGLAVGMALTPVIVEALQAISSLPLPHRSAGAWLGWSLIGAVSLTLISGLYPVWRMNRFDAVRAVRTG